MSQRGNTVFFDKYQTTPSGSNIQIITNAGAPPTTFSTNSVGSLVISNDWNGVTINGSGTNPDLCFGPDDNFYAKLDGTPDGFQVYTNNVQTTAALVVDDSGDTTVSGSFTVDKETTLTGNVTIRKHILSGSLVSMSNISTNATSVQVLGNDTTGQITFNRVSGLGSRIRVNFITAYTTLPHVVVTASNGESVNSPYYIETIDRFYFTLYVGGVTNTYQCSYSYIVIG
jgi:hypothetical protein